MDARFKVVGLGEVLWDVFPEGPRFGGAPANFACHAAMLGAEAFVVSRVGDDELGDRALASLRGHGVDAEFVARDANRPTGTVRVEVDKVGKPRFDIGADVAWDHVAWSDALATLAGRADAVSFGTLGQRGEQSRQTIRRFLAATRLECLRIFDINLRQQFYDQQLVLDSMALANALKLNDDELSIVAPMLGVAGPERDALATLRERFGLNLVALTRGEHGAVLVSASAISECEGTPTAVKDTVGAGDSFTAALTLGWLQGRDLDTIVRHACRVASFVCSQAGATPPLPEELRA